MPASTPYRIKSIKEAYLLSGSQDKPHHPLIGMIDLKGMRNDSGIDAVIVDFYAVSLKRGCDKLLYGQQKYDFDEGVMGFLAPGQILRGEDGKVPGNLEGWMLLIHPDFLWNTALAKKIKQYDYFGYHANEALFLSDKEEGMINTIIDNIKNEYQANIDKFSQDVIIAQLDLLFTYGQRFYERQFITRKISNNRVLERLEAWLENYYNDDAMTSKGLPSVQSLADALHLSKKYLGSLLKQLTGMTTQQHIHEKLIEKAKEKLSGSGATVSEIAYELGFEHSQSFNKFFKAKTKQTPLEFREKFN
ncbi:AraC family transcriptional regulator [Chitinophaga caeni]|uniref:AraC family transcriptional regulator n=1 Tax=Chitinophaga caeni TaxID=2029983 RepID=A0A291QYH8_9BACT|nr:AraC family transcriptional regulator [Chitinophaga caeni]ATL48923.1 AraC family transcriptional regulator [Chitinophaga caeni]